MNQILEQQHQVLSQFRIIFGAVREHFRRLELDTGLPGTEIWLLHLVEQKPGISVNEIAEAMYVHQSTASNLIASLVKKNLLMKQKAHMDRRVSVLALSAQGGEILSRATPPREGLLPALIKTLPEHELIQLTTALDLLTRNLPKDSEKNKQQPLATL